jgi:antirestriction protein ArdC
MRAYQAMPMRPYADPDSRKSKAIEYARWLAARDGIELPNTLNATVHFVPVKQTAFKSPVICAAAVSFGNVTIKIPNHDYDPTAPAIEETEPEAPTPAPAAVIALPRRRNLYAEVTARILAELERGAAPWVKPWKSYGVGAQPRNVVTSRPYSGVNVVLLWMAVDQHGYDNPRWLTFKQALDVGGNVRKGEKATRIYFVSSVEKRDAEDGDSEQEARRVSFLKEYYVFNVAQCENLPQNITSSERAPINPDRRDELADEFLSATGADIREGHGEAYYAPSADFVSMPAFGAFTSADNFYSVAFHELSHWTGHKTRLDRDLRNRFGTEAYAAEELVAELSAAFLCSEFGYDGDLRHAAYIENWIRLLKADDRAFFTAASKAQKAADYLRGLALREPARMAA